ncbi:MAG TPA: FAD-dependent oxidoreductase [Lacunisphaera sp.]|jgi:NADH dehydrogenase
MPQQRIVIIGGGFAGVKCARILRSQLRKGDADIILFNEENHLVFSPLLADAVGSSLNLQDVIVPLRQLLPDVMCRMEQVNGIDLASDCLEYKGHDGLPRQLHYDHIVIACGNVSNLNVVPGMADHAYPLKSVGDAAVLRTHILEQLEKAEVCDDPERRRWYLSFIVVGGGYSGVETAGEINDLVRSSQRFYSNFSEDDVSVTLIHSRDQLLPEISPSLREFAREKMAAAGVTIKLNTRVQLATGEGVGTADGFIHGATIVCTIGSTTAPIIERLDTPKEKGRLLTDPDMRLRGNANAWAIGDCALITNALDGEASPPTGQFAERQGRQCAQNILRVINGEPTRPFSFKLLGQLCSIGGHNAVAEMFGLKLSGFLAWFTWRGVYLFKLPAWSRRIQVGFDWAWLLLFPRDLACIKTEVTDRVTHAHYEAGDYIFRQGDMAANFYVIEQGEVEICRTTNEHPEGDIIATLGPGSFFGEQALIDNTNRPRSASVRARSAVEVVVMGRNVFTSISKTLAPLRSALMATIARRMPNVWQERPRVRAALRDFKLADFIDPAPQPILRPTETLFEVTKRFGESDEQFFFVSPDGERLEGLVTLTDLLRAQATGTTAETPLGDFMIRNPAVITTADTCLVAAAAFREHGHKLLPVVHDRDRRTIAGVIRARKLITRIMQVVGPPAAPKADPVDFSVAAPDRRG